MAHLGEACERRHSAPRRPARSAATSKRPRTGGGGRSGSTLTPPKPVTYADLGGIEPILDDIRELIEYPLKHPEVGGWVGRPGRGTGPRVPSLGGATVCHQSATSDGSAVPWVCVPPPVIPAAAAS